MTASRYGANILVIDEDRARREAYRAVLGDLANNIEVLASEEGIRRLGERAFDVAVVHLDAARGVAGFDAVSFGRALARDARRPTLLISSGDLDFPALAGAGLEQFDHVPAGTSDDVLRNKVGLFLELQSLRATVSEQERASAELKSLLGEQIHRGKNLLATMQSIALRTISEGRDVKEARLALVGRLRALAKIYDLVSDSSPKGALLADIVELGLGESATRASASGPAVRLSGSLAQTFALIIHELTTNAVRHGALCADGGSVAVGWTLFEAGSDRYLEVGWAERGGPPAKAQPRRGFGLALVASLAPPDDDPNYSFDGEGFACRIRLPSHMITTF